jgi:hypothetical protein
MEERPFWPYFAYVLQLLQIESVKIRGRLNLIDRSPCHFRQGTTSVNFHSGRALSCPECFQDIFPCSLLSEHLFIETVKGALLRDNGRLANE